MSKPNNSISKIKLPGESTGRPIVPYYLGVSSSNNFVATLPALTEDKIIATADQIVTIISADWEEVQMITFTIQGSVSSLGTWSVPVGTTWGDLNTCYNSANSYYITGTTIYTIINNSPQNAGTISTNGQNSGDVSSTDVIVNGTTYYARTAQSGGSGR